MQSMRGPSGSLRFGTTQRVDASARDLAGLATDLSRLQLMDPRLCVAEWLDGGPGVGNTAFVKLDVRFSHEWVSRAVGDQRGTVRLVDLVPARRVAYLVASNQGDAFLLATFEDQDVGCSVRITGWIMPSRPRIRSGLRLLRPLVVRLTTRSLRRALIRASMFLRNDEVARGGSLRGA